MKIEMYLLLFVLFCYGTINAMDTVVIATDDYDPYTLYRDNGSGVILDIIREAFAKVEVEVQFRFMPWKRCEMNVSEGKLFAATPYFKTDKRLKEYDFSDPLILSRNVFFYNKETVPDDFFWTELSDFKEYRMGGVIGYWYMEAFKKAGLKVSLVPTDLQMLKMILLNRIDFCVLDEITGRRLINTHLNGEMEHFGILEKPESIDSFHLLISRIYPGSKELTEKFNRGLRALKESGEYHKILKRYGFAESFAVK